MTTMVDVVLCFLSTDDGGLVKVQSSGTRSLYFHFGWSGVDVDFGGFLDLRGGIDVKPGLGPVTGVLTLWAAEANSIEPGQAFSIRYPTRVVGYGLVRAVRPDLSQT